MNNPHLISRLAKQQDVSDFLLMFENHDRAREMSANTKAGAPAPLPPRPPVSRELRPVSA